MTKKQTKIIPDIKTLIPNDQILRIVNSDHHDPFQVLGIHPIEQDSTKKISIRAFFPEAKKVIIKNEKTGEETEMLRFHEKGFFVMIFQEDKIFPYKYKITGWNDNTWESYDPYAYLPVIPEQDLYLFHHKGNDHRIYYWLGSHVKEIDGKSGILFAVWAPNAKRVSVVGNFNGWDGRKYQMRNRGGSGIWELFIPGMVEGEYYKYEIKTADNRLLEKADPYAYFSENRPKTASVVYNIDKYQWKDSDWLEKRATEDQLSKPISVYEVHAGSWRRKVSENNAFLTYRDMEKELIPYVKEMGFTHIELMPVSEHPLDASWGYQVTGYYAVSSRFGTPNDFQHFVDKAHNEGIGIIIDWVPGHFPKDEFSLANYDGTHLYEHSDPRKREHPDWGTYIFNYGRNEVRNFLISNALFWFDKYHIDGLRVDAVASMLYLDYGRKQGEWLPNQYGGKENLEAIFFMKRLNELVHAYYPGVLMIAEESTSWPGVSRPTYLGGLGFTLKWNMGWMNDVLSYFENDPIHRKYHQDNLTFGLVYAFNENFVLVLSHDEVVHGKKSLLNKMPGDYWQKFANLRLLYGFMYGHPGKKLIFMGGEFAQWREWNFEESLDWHLLNYEHHRKIQKFVKDLNFIYRNESALYERDFTADGFQWIDFQDKDNSVLSFVRYDKDRKNHIVFVYNFTPVPRADYKIGFPEKGFYREIINSDSSEYGGSNLGNLGGIHSEEIAFHGFKYSQALMLPPLSMLAFKKEEKDI